ncbi:serine palmitoyltransferase [Lentinula aff. detonsa]|uniref:serine C-palmitoyltransferase n=1 Tax=Lentinula aff. detonsa TaxID=2804958 RepID=A0AA38KHQ4_9AGAR|nr:serine palmitoyltransferase [Lentinula aff. detonsa]KAJ3802329.1 serine palmitoyltransferase [Lentinula aff. detonsa]
MASASSPLDTMVLSIAQSLSAVERTFYKLPGSAIIERYVRSSHQNDPGRTFLELIIFFLVVRTLLQSRTRADRNNGKNFIEFTDKEIDELVEDWVPEPLSKPLDDVEAAELAAIPVVAGHNGPHPTLVNTGKPAINLASLNFTGLANNEHVKQRSLEAMRRYGVGSCGPTGFYGSFDAHLQCENDIAEFLDTEGAILYSQGFSTISSAIPAFCKRGDIIVADRAVTLAIQKGMEISRSTIRWYDHNDLHSLEEVLQSVEKERRKRKGPLTRRFIITEGIFERDGTMTDLPKLIELKQKYKYRLILDESFSFGTVGRTGRGLTELYNVKASKVDMLVGSCAIGLCASGGFCAGSRTVVEHQRINSPAYVFSASMPPLLAVSASEGINVLRDTPSLLTRLQENVRAARVLLDQVECISIPSHRASPIIHLYLRNNSSSDNLLHPSASMSSSKPSNPSSPIPRDAPVFDIEKEERLLQEVVEEAMAQGVLITKAKRARGLEITEAQPSIRLAMSSALSKADTEKAVHVLVKILKRKFR